MTPFVFGLAELYIVWFDLFLKWKWNGP